MDLSKRQLAIVTTIKGKLRSLLMVNKKDDYTADKIMGFVEQYGPTLIGDRLMPFLFMIAGFFPISISLVIALESFVGEKERGSIEPLLVSPISDGELFFGKLLAVVVPPLLASYLGILVYMFGVYRNIGWTPGWILFIQVVLLTTMQALVMVSGAVVVSTQTTSVRAANLLASFIIIPMTFLIQGESMIMFWGDSYVLWWVIFGLAIIAGLLIRTGISHFNREELLGRELDSLNLRWGWQTFMSEFKGEATSIWTWYRGEVFPALKRMWLPILAMAVLLGVGWWMGMQQAEIFVVPDDLLDLDLLDRGAFADMDEVVLFSSRGIPIIWLHNLRTVGLAMLLGVMTFGIGGMLIMMLPMVILGFLMATLMRAGLPPETFLLAFVLPHGVLEIPAIVLTGAAIFQMGAGIASSATGKSVGESWVHSLAGWAKITLAVIVPLFFGAAILEALVTPQVALQLLGQ